MADVVGRTADVTGDGVADIGAFDQDGDGSIDTVQSDTNGDGVVDAVGYDADQDGRIEVLHADATGDGVLDSTVADTNGDGSFETVVQDLDQNGSADAWTTDANGNGLIDAGEQTSAWAQPDTVTIGGDSGDPWTIVNPDGTPAGDVLPGTVTIGGGTGSGLLDFGGIAARSQILANAPWLGEGVTWVEPLGF